jgi:hypothetical protein
MSEEPRKIPSGQIHACILPGAPENVAGLIRPCRPKREWMDRTSAAYAYRCIPMSAANTMGWEILNPVNCEFRWNGLTPHKQVFVYREKEVPYGPKSHFGTGVITWDIPFLFRTPPEYGLVVTGPANHDRDHITPLDAFIRSDWLPFPFTMNWRITKADVAIRFKAGEPIARIYPYPLALLDEMQLELHNLAEDPEFNRRFLAWGKQRKQNYQQRSQVQATAKPGDNPDLDGLWNKQYAQGSGADNAAQEHQTIFRCAKVTDRRAKKDGQD